MDPHVGTLEMDVAGERRFLAYGYLREHETEYLIQSAMRAYFTILQKAFGGS